MTSPVDAIKDRYVEQITRAVPVFRVLLVFVAVLMVHAIRKNSDEGYWIFLGGLSFDYFMDSGFAHLRSISLADLVLAGAFVITAAVTYKLLRIGCFRLFSKLSNFEAYLSGMKRKPLKSIKSADAIDLLLAKEAGEVLSTVEEAVRQRAAFGELIFGVAVIGIYPAWHGNPLDVWVVVLSFPFVLFLQWKNFHLIVREYVPAWYAKEQLLGREVSERTVEDL